MKVWQGRAVWKGFAGLAVWKGFAGAGLFIKDLRFMKEF